jgi:hypothetical protein
MSVSACSSVTSLWVPFHRIDVDSVEQPLQLFDGDLNHGLLTARPRKTVCFKPFQQHPEAVLIPKKQLYAVAPAIGEAVDDCGKRVKRERLLDDRRQPVNGKRAIKDALSVRVKVVAA